MPLSKTKDRERKRAERAVKRQVGELEEDGQEPPYRVADRERDLAAIRKLAYTLHPEWRRSGERLPQDVGHAL